MAAALAPLPAHEPPAAAAGAAPPNPGAAVLAEQWMAMVEAFTAWSAGGYADSISLDAMRAKSTALDALSTACQALLMAGDMTEGAAAFAVDPLFNLDLTDGALMHFYTSLSRVRMHYKSGNVQHATNVLTQALAQLK